MVKKEAANVQVLKHMKKTMRWLVKQHGSSSGPAGPSAAAADDAAAAAAAPAAAPAVGTVPDQRNDVMDVTDDDVDAGGARQLPGPPCATVGTVFFDGGGGRTDSLKGETREERRQRQARWRDKYEGFLATVLSQKNVCMNSKPPKKLTKLAAACVKPWPALVRRRRREREKWAP